MILFVLAVLLMALPAASPGSDLTKVIFAEFSWVKSEQR